MILFLSSRGPPTRKEKDRGEGWPAFGAKNSNCGLARSLDLFQSARSSSVLLYYKIILWGTCSKQANNIHTVATHTN